MLWIEFLSDVCAFSMVGTGSSWDIWRITRPVMAKRWDKNEQDRFHRQEFEQGGTRDGFQSLLGLIIRRRKELFISTLNVIMGRTAPAQFFLHRLHLSTKPVNVMQPPKQILIDRFKDHVQSLQLFKSILVIHKHTIVKLKAITRRVLHQKPSTVS